MTDSEVRCVDELGGTFVSVSPAPLLASHSIVLAHAALDLEEEEEGLLL